MKVQYPTISMSHCLRRCCRNFMNEDPFGYTLWAMAAF